LSGFRPSDPFSELGFQDEICSSYGQEEIDSKEKGAGTPAEGDHDHCGRHEEKEEKKACQENPEEEGAEKDD